ncbi:hypothetical protein ACHWQZ_G010007 [Mnemiopsis leidyi]
MVRLGNFSADGIHNGDEQVILTTYLVLIFLSSSIGDSIILLSTIKFNSIKLHRVIVVVIQHMAVNDLIQTLFLVLPQIVSLQAGDWILGLFLCHLSEHVSYVCNVVTGTLTCLLVGSKLLVVIYPLKSISWRSRSAHKLCGLCWILGMINPQELSNIFLTGHDSVYFDYYDYTCDYDSLHSREPKWWKWFCRITGGLGLLLVSVTLLTTSVLLLLTASHAAEKRGECLRWRGVLTVVMTTAIYLVSWMPYFVVRTSTVLMSVQYKIEIRRTVRSPEGKLEQQCLTPLSRFKSRPCLGDHFGISIDDHALSSPR